MQIFADLSALSRNRRGPEADAGAGDPRPEGAPEADSGERAHNPQEYLHAFLRSRDADAEGLPEPFRARLRAALGHYGVTEPGDPDDDALASALYRIFLAHRRAGAHVPVLLDLLQWRLGHAAVVTTLPRALREEYLHTLEHLITATQVRHPVVGDLARRVRFRAFDEPLMEATRARGQKQVRAELDRLADTADPAARAAVIDEIVAAAEPILSVFADRHHAAMLEVMTRRYYRIRHLEGVRVDDRGGRPLLSAMYRHDGRDNVVLATTVHTTASAPAAGEPPAVQADLRHIVGRLPADTTVLLDLYVTAGKAPDDDPERSAEKIRMSLGTLPAPLDRVAVAVRRAGADERSSWFTFRPGPDREPVEDRTLRGLHPMVAERLGLWRLAAFDLTRLPSPIDVHLFRAVGRRMSDDRRLLAFSDVRDLSAVRDEHGGIRALPQLEHVLDACLDALRAARAVDRTDARSDWNRVLLYVWPVVDLPLREFDSVVSRLAPRTEGLGLEQVLVQFRAAAHLLPDGTPKAEPRELLLRLSHPPGAGPTLRVTEPPAGPLRELDAYAQKVIRARRRGAVYPYELVPMLGRNPDVDGRSRDVHRVRPRRRRGAGAGGPRTGAQHGEHRARHGHHLHAALPRRHDARGADRRPDEGARGDRGAGMPPRARGTVAGP